MHRRPQQPRPQWPKWVVNALGVFLKALFVLKHNIVVFLRLFLCWMTMITVVPLGVSLSVNGAEMLPSVWLNIILYLRGYSILNTICRLTEGCAFNRQTKLSNCVHIFQLRKNFCSIWMVGSSFIWWSKNVGGRKKHHCNATITQLETRHHQNGTACLACAPLLCCELLFLSVFRRMMLKDKSKVLAFATFPLLVFMPQVWLEQWQTNGWYWR